MAPPIYIQEACRSWLSWRIMQPGIKGDLKLLLKAVLEWSRNPSVSINQIRRLQDDPLTPKDFSYLENKYKSEMDSLVMTDFEGISSTCGYMSDICAMGGVAAAGFPLAAIINGTFAVIFSVISRLTGGRANTVNHEVKNHAEGVFAKLVSDLYQKHKSFRRVLKGILPGLDTKLQWSIENMIAALPDRERKIVNAILGQLPENENRQKIENIFYDTMKKFGQQINTEQEINAETIKNIESILNNCRIMGAFLIERLFDDPKLAVGFNYISKAIIDIGIGIARKRLGSISGIGLAEIITTSLVSLVGWLSDSDQDPEQQILQDIYNMIVDLDKRLGVIEYNQVLILQQLGKIAKKIADLHFDVKQELNLIYSQFSMEQEDKRIELTSKLAQAVRMLYFVGKDMRAVEFFKYMNEIYTYAVDCAKFRCYTGYTSKELTNKQLLSELINRKKIAFNIGLMSHMLAAIGLSNTKIKPFKVVNPLEWAVATNLFCHFVDIFRSKISNDKFLFLLERLYEEGEKVNVLLRAVSNESSLNTVMENFIATLNVYNNENLPSLILDVCRDLMEFLNKAKVGLSLSQIQTLTGRIHKKWTKPFSRVDTYAAFYKAIKPFEANYTYYVDVNESEEICLYHKQTKEDPYDKITCSLGWAADKVGNTDHFIKNFSETEKAIEFFKYPLQGLKIKYVMYHSTNKPYIRDFKGWREQVDEFKRTLPKNSELHNRLLNLKSISFVQFLMKQISIEERKKYMEENKDIVTRRVLLISDKQQYKVALNSLRLHDVILRNFIVANYWIYQSKLDFNSPGYDSIESFICNDFWIDKIIKTGCFTDMSNNSHFIDICRQESRNRVNNRFQRIRKNVKFGSVENNKSESFSVPLINAAQLLLQKYIDLVRSLNAESPRTGLVCKITREVFSCLRDYIIDSIIPRSKGVFSSVCSFFCDNREFLINSFVTGGLAGWTIATLKNGQYKNRQDLFFGFPASLILFGIALKLTISSFKNNNKNEVVSYSFAGLTLSWMMASFFNSKSSNDLTNNTHSLGYNQ